MITRSLLRISSRITVSSRRVIVQFRTKQQQQQHFVARMISPHRNQSTTTILKPFEVENIQHAQMHIEYEKETARRLISENDYPIASYSPETWFEAQNTLPFWAEQRSIESVQITFQLLERLMLEKRAINYEFDTPWINQALVEKILNNWRIVAWQHSMPDYTPIKVWDRIEKLSLSLPLTEKMYHHVIEAQIRLDDQQPEFCQRLLDRCIQQFHAGNELCKPTTKLYNLVILAWAKSEKEDAPKHADALMNDMLHNEIGIDRRTYSHVMEAHANAGNALQAQSLLERMYAECKAGDESVRPGVDGFCSVIAGWARSKDPQAPSRAESVLNEMIRLWRAKELRIDKRHSVISTFNACLQCMANQKTLPASSRAHDWYKALGKLGFKPDLITYRTVIWSWGNIGRPDMAESVLRDCLKAYQSGNLKEKPSVDLFARVIQAWARCRERNRFERAQAIVSYLEESDDEDVRPNAMVYNNLLDCLAHSSMPQSGDKAEEIFNRMQELSESDENVKPNIFSYVAVLHAWANLGISKKAEAFYYRMLQDYKNGNEEAKPTLKIVNTVLSSYINDGDPGAPQAALAFLQEFEDQAAQGVLDFQPDVYSYTSVLSALVKGKDHRPPRETAQRGEDLFRKMQNMYSSGDKAMQPTAASYNSVMNGWARAKRPDRVEIILSEMLHDFEQGNAKAAPTTQTFNILIKAWAMSRKYNAAEKVEEILDRMKELCDSGAISVQPDVITYTTAMLAYNLGQRPDALHRTEELFQELEQRHAAGYIREGPSLKTFETIRRAWLSSNEPNKAEKVASLEMEMEKRFGKVPKARNSSTTNMMNRQHEQQ